MIFTTRQGESFDTDTDLTAPERHALQKLFLWETHAKSLRQFAEKKEDALQKGWNNSGPVIASAALMAIIRELEQRLTDRLAKAGEDSP